MERTPYLRYLKECLRHAEDSGVFGEDRHALLLRDCCLADTTRSDSLPELSQCLLARLLMRAGEWHRSDRLLSCMPRDLFLQSAPSAPAAPTSVLEAETAAKGTETVTGGTSLAEEGLREALAGLHGAGLLETLGERHSFAEAWSALQECLFADEIRQVHFSISKIKAKGDKVDVLNSIHRAAKTSVDLFNRPISLFRQMKSALTRANSTGGSSEQVTLVRLAPPLLVALRRMQRILQMSSATGEVSSGRSCCTVSKPLHFNAAMLTMVGRVRFPRYQIIVPRHACPSFPSLASFRLWEAANELRACFDEVQARLSVRGKEKDKDGDLSGFFLRPSMPPSSPLDPSPAFGLQLTGLAPVQSTQVHKLRSRVLTACQEFDNVLLLASPSFDHRPVAPSVNVSASADFIDLTTSDDNDEEDMHEDSRRRKRIKCIRQTKKTRPKATLHGSGGCNSDNNNDAEKTEEEEEHKGERWREKRDDAFASLLPSPTLVMDRLLRLKPAAATGDRHDRGLAGATMSLSILSFITIGAAACLIGYLEKQLCDKHGKLSQSLPFLNQLDAGNILTAMCFDGVEAMEKEIRENIAAATAAMTLASDEEVHSVEEGVEGRDSVNAKNQRIPVPSSASLGFSLSSYALPIQILRLLVHGDYISDSTEAAAGADAATFTCKSEASALVRRYCSRRVGKTVERLCIDLEHEGATAWALGEVTRGLQDSDVQSSYHIGFNKRQARLLHRTQRGGRGDRKQVQVDSKRLKIGGRKASFPSLVGMLKGICHQTAPPSSLSSSHATQKKLVTGPRASVSSSTASSTALWACVGCTLLNSSKSWKCSLCQTDRVLLPPPAAVIRGDAQQKSHCILICQDDEDDEDDIFEATLPSYAASSRAKSSRRSVEGEDGSRRLSRKTRAAAQVAVQKSTMQEKAPATRSGQHLNKNIGEVSDLHVTSTLSVAGASPCSLQSPPLALKEHNTPPGGSLSPAASSSPGIASTLHAYCTKPLADAEMQRLLFNGRKNEYTTGFFHQAVHTMAVAGRRLGSMRPGKNKLIGVSGDAVSVERLVMQTMEQPFEEGVVTFCSKEAGSALETGTDDEVLSGGADCSSTKQQILEHFCGGWVGWHCEGSPLRSIFGLMMWSELFPCDPHPPSQDSSKDKEREEEEEVEEKEKGDTADAYAGGTVFRPPHCYTHPLPPPCPPVPGVFRTPYQDAPLDLLTPGGLFYRNRRESIERKLAWIQTAPICDLIAYLGEVYRENYRSRCLCVSWNHPLRALQAVTASLGGSGVHAVCRLMSTDYRQFSSGAPDLLMIRGHFPPPPVAEAGVLFCRADWEACLGPGWELLGGEGEQRGVTDEDEDLGGNEEIPLSQSRIGTMQSETGLKPQGEQTQVLSGEGSGGDNVGVKASKTVRRKFVYVGGKRRYISDGRTSSSGTNPNRGRKKGPNHPHTSCSTTDVKHFSIFQKQCVSRASKKAEQAKEVIDLDSDSASDYGNSCEKDTMDKVNYEKVNTEEVEKGGKEEEKKGASSDLLKTEEVDKEKKEEEKKGDSSDLLKTEPSRPGALLPSLWRFRCHQEDLVLPVSPQRVADMAEEHSYEDGNVEANVRLECMMVEVKGPSDRLSDRQRVWCQALAAHGVAVRVCRVDEGAGGYHATAGSESE